MLRSPSPSPLVISTGVPASFDELTPEMLEAPAFGVAFALIMSFRLSHWNRSRRFGLEDGRSITRGCVRVFRILVFVHPLRYLATLFAHVFSRGRLSPDAAIDAARLHDIFAICGFGYVALALTIIALNAHALRTGSARCRLAPPRTSLRDQLRLDTIELFLARTQIRAWSILAGVGTLSAALAPTLPVSRLMLARVQRRCEGAAHLTPRRAEDPLADLTDFAIEQYPHHLFQSRIWQVRAKATTA